MAFWWGLGSIFSVCLIGPFSIFLALAAFRNAKLAVLEVEQGRTLASEIRGAKSGRIMAWCAIVFSGLYAGFVAFRILMFILYP